MTTPYLSEIRIMSFGFPPKGWALCDGQLLPINQNQALFSLLGTTYGGDGQRTFALPNLQGSVPMHMGSGHVLGERGGEQAHTLNISELSQHSHPFGANSAAANNSTPGGNVLAKTTATNYESVNTLVAMGSSNSGNQVISNIGGNQAHLNMQPFLTLSFCIALQGIFPSQT